MHAIQLLWVPLLVAVLLIGIHTYLGLHVLARRIIFVDLALAQIAALGATLAFMLGYPPQSITAYGYSLLFTLSGAVLLSFSRQWINTRVSQEVIVGVIYVVASAAAIIMIDRSPQGAEHLKQILTGSLLTTTSRDLLHLFILYGVVAALHFGLRRNFIALSFETDHPSRPLWKKWWWDFLFYALFGIVVTSSVAVAGVLLVFSFLIIPAAIGTLYSNRIRMALTIGWITGLFVCLAGMFASYHWDLPTGASVVCSFGVGLALAGLLKPLILHQTQPRRVLLIRSVQFIVRASLILIFVSAAWLVVRPQADQPLFDLIEYVQPDFRNLFLNPAEQQQWNDSLIAEAKVMAETQRLNQKERDSRWQGETLSDDEVKHLSSFTQSYMEMSKGEHVVQRVIRDKARTRQRWVLGFPLILISLGVWIGLFNKNRHTNKHTN